MTPQDFFVTGELDEHPLARKTPSLTPAEYAHLKEKIASEGLLLAVVLYQGKILDGRHRYRVCRELGIPVRARQYQGDDPVGAICSLNTTQRQMDATDRVLMAFDFAPDYKQRAQERVGEGQKSGGRGHKKTLVSQDTGVSTADEHGRVRYLLGQEVGVSEQTVQRALDVERIAPKEIEGLRRRRQAQKAKGVPPSKLETITGLWRLVVGVASDGRSDAARQDKEGEDGDENEGGLGANYHQRTHPWTISPPTVLEFPAWRKAFRDLEKHAKRIWDQKEDLRAVIAHREGEWALKARSAAVDERRWMEAEDKLRAAVALAYGQGRIHQRRALQLLKMNPQQFQQLLSDYHELVPDHDIREDAG